ncbi:MAG: hypothetical protein IPF66_11835 [Holophagales bacterium]|nr:hypothetical protein [Holophagales bacterium]
MAAILCCASGEITGRLEGPRERLVSRDRRGIDRPVPEELAQDVDGVPGLAVCEVGFRQLEKHVGDTGIGAADGGQEVPGPVAMPSSQGVPRRLEPPARAEEKRNRLVEPAPLLEDERRIGELPGGPVQRDRAFPVLQLPVDAGREL